MELKQVIVMRKDLNMRKGKLAAQVAHSSNKVFLDLCHKDKSLFDENQFTYTFNYNKGSNWDKWLNGLFTKIVVSCDSEKELEDLYQKAKDANLPCSLIVDAGLTEFRGIPTKTCIAIGPADPEEINKITSHLKLL